MSTPGLITLIGSGETAPSGRVLYEPAFDRLPKPVKVSIMETPAGFELNSPHVASRVSEFIQHRLQNYKPDVTVVPARRRDAEFGTNNPDILRPLLDADCIFMGPGSPSYTVRHLTGTYAWDMMQARHRLGACLTFASSAAIAIGETAVPIYEIYKVGDDPHWIPGLDLLGPLGLRIACVTHWNNAEGGANLDTSRCYIGKARLETLLPALSNGTVVVGVDEHTALTLDFSEMKCRVLGKGTVTLVDDVTERVYKAGSDFPMSELGDVHIPDAQEGISPEVWAETVAAQQRREEVVSELPVEVAALISEREEARRMKQWDRADALRDQIAEMGYTVTDTPEGPQWQVA